MARITLGGLSSGMDTDMMLERILAADQARITSQQAKKTKLQEKQTAWGEVKTSLSALRSKLDSLRLVSTFRGRAVSLTDDKVASVSVAAGVPLGTHSLSVSKLAKSHAIAGDSDVTSATTALGLSGSFKVKVGATEYTVAVNSNDSLNMVRENINAAAGGIVTAEVVKVQVDTGGGVLQDRYRLQLTSKTQGQASAITLTQVTAGLLETSTGLGFFSDGTTTVPASQVISAAQDAQFTLDNQTYKMGTNTIADVLPGVTINLLKADAVTPPQTNFTVTQSTQGVVDAVKAWVDQLNSTIDVLKAKTDYTRNSDSGQITGAGVLTQDPLARDLLDRLRGMISNQVSGLPTDLDSLYDVGVSMGAYGTEDYGKVTFDSTKLTAKLTANEDGVAKLFGALRTNLGLVSSNPLATFAESSPPDPDAATYGAANAFNNLTDPTRFGSAGGGWRSGSVPTAATPQFLALNMGAVKSVDQVRLYLPDGVTTDGLKNFSIQYSTDSTDGSDGTWTTIQQVTDNTGTLRSLSFNPVDAKWIRLNVTETYGGAPAKVLEMNVLQATKAPTASMYTYVNSSLTSITGPVESQENALTEKISDIDDRLERMLDSMEKREDRLRAQFTRMEQALAKLQSQGTALVAQITGMTSRR